MNVSKPFVSSFISYIMVQSQPTLHCPAHHHHLSRAACTGENPSLPQNCHPRGMWNPDENCWSDRWFLLYFLGDGIEWYQSTVLHAIYMLFKHLTMPHSWPCTTIGGISPPFQWHKIQFQHKVQGFFWPPLAVHCQQQGLGPPLWGFLKLY